MNPGNCPIHSVLILPRFHLGIDRILGSLGNFRGSSARTGRRPSRSSAMSTSAGPRNVPIFDREDSGGASLVEGEDAAEPFASADAADGRGRIVGGEGDDVAQALVVALGVVVLHKLTQHGAQMTLAERDDVPEALLLDR